MFIHNIQQLVIAQLVERETVVHCADISRSLVQFRLARINFFVNFLNFLFHFSNSKLKQK